MIEFLLLLLLLCLSFEVQVNVTFLVKPDLEIELVRALNSCHSHLFLLMRVNFLALCFDNLDKSLFVFAFTVIIRVDLD